MFRFSSFLAGTLFCSSSLLAQTATPNMPVDEVSKLITYTEVAEAKGLSKDTIYNRTYRWFQSFYKNPAQAIKLADKENFTIEGGYRFTVKRPDPAAKKDPSSPLYGMPTLNAEASQNVIVIKRGRGTGFSGVENPLFVADNTRMLFGDGQKVANQLIQAVKEL
jgi:hypothetical protein